MISLKIFGTPVRVKPPVWAILIVLWAGVSWLGYYWHPGRGIWQSALIGLATTILLVVVDFGHALAHIFSARFAGAPMDEILLSADMPRTIYLNNDVSPDVHRLRALGGPIFNLVGFLVSLAVFGLAPEPSIFRELAGWSAAGHGLLLVMSLMPLPIIDGGTLLKWTLVAKGRTESQADEIMRRIDLVLGLLSGVASVALLFLRLWIPGLIFIGAGAIILSVAAGMIQ